MRALSAPARFARARPLEIAVAISALLSGIYLIWQPGTTDLAAQVFRADLWEREGFVIWNADWYSGHTVPGYSLLYPPLGAWLGPALVAALSAVASTYLFGRLALGVWGERAWLGVIWFGLAPAATIYSGRITFALGMAIGLAALLAVRHRRIVLAAIAGLLTAAASPVSALFLLLACAAVILESWWPLERGWPPRRRPPRSELPAAAAAAAGLGSALLLGALVIAFPTDGYQPFTFGSFIWIPLLVLGVWALFARSEDRGVILWGALLYGALGLAAILIETPLGGNTTRLGATFAGPLLAILLIGRRPLLLAVVLLPLLWWQWTTTVNDVAATIDEPSNDPAYYEPLLERLDSLEAGDGPALVHVPPSRNRWEAVHVAERHPMTRGWLRQLESDDFDLFDGGPLQERAYLDWLADRGASFVAVNDAEPDYLAERERELLDSGALDERQVFSDGHWRLYDVSRPGPREREPAQGGASLLELGPDGFTVALAGDASLPLRYTPYFEVVEGFACVAADPGDPRRTLLRPTVAAGSPAAAETVRVEARFSLAAAGGRDLHCRHPE